MVVVAAVSLCVIAAGIGVANAATNVTNNNQMSELVTAIASKFNLNASDVQAVFDGQKTKMDAARKEKMAEMETKHQQEFATRLSQAVAAGKLTQVQAGLITSKKAELEASSSNLEGKTAEERRAAMATQMESLKQWAKDNNIPEGYLPCGFGHGRGFGGLGFQGK